MHSLVTGGGGFLGRYIVEQLLARGDAVRVLARGEYSELTALGVELVRGDVRDPEAVRNAVRGCDAVFHVAAIPGIWGPWKTYYEINTLGTRHVLDACRTEGVSRLIHTSSPSVVYDGQPHMDADESLPYPNKFLCHYPHSKMLAERDVLAANGSRIASRRAVDTLAGQIAQEIGANAPGFAAKISRGVPNRAVDPPPGPLSKQGGGEIPRSAAQTLLQPVAADIADPDAVDTLRGAGGDTARGDRTPLARRREHGGTEGPAVDDSHTLKTVALRPHLIWGPRDPHLVPRLIARARAGRLVRVGDGTNVVSMSYVENAARAHVLAEEALRNDESAVAGRAYFINEPEPVNLWHWIDQLLALAGLPPVKRAISPRAAYAAGALLEGLYTALPLPGEPPMTRFLASQLSQSHSYSTTNARRDLGDFGMISVAEGMQRIADEVRTASRNQKVR